jgi:hypothetical protein
MTSFVTRARTLESSLGSVPFRSLLLFPRLGISQAAQAGARAFMVILYGDDKRSVKIEDG